MATATDDAVLYGTMSGSMVTGLMLNYCDIVLVPYLKGTKKAPDPSSHFLNVRFSAKIK